MIDDLIINGAIENGSPSETVYFDTEILQSFISVVHPLVLNSVELTSTLALPTE